MGSSLVFLWDFCVCFLVFFPHLFFFLVYVILFYTCLFLFFHIVVVVVVVCCCCCCYYHYMPVWIHVFAGVWIWMDRSGEGLGGAVGEKTIQN